MHVTSIDIVYNYWFKRGLDDNRIEKFKEFYIYIHFTYKSAFGLYIA